MATDVHSTENGVGDSAPSIPQNNGGTSYQSMTTLDINHPLYLSTVDILDRFPTELGNQWERVNAIVLSWLMNSVSTDLLGGVVHASSSQDVWNDLKERFDKVDGSRTYNLYQEIATISQGFQSVSVYFTKMKGLWNEFEFMVPSPACNCERSREFVVYLQRQKLYQFFMGLNDTYSQVRSQIRLMSPLPNVNMAYSMIMSDESQKTVAQSINYIGLLGAAPNVGDVLAMYSKNSYPGGGYQKGKRDYVSNYNPTAFCDHCKLKGHYRVDCFKLVSYPSGHPKHVDHKENADTRGSAGCRKNYDNRSKQRRTGPSAHNAMIGDLQS
ncbi:hypothetical protein P3L10_031874 [Capsicum annuum]